MTRPSPTFAPRIADAVAGASPGLRSPLPARTPMTTLALRHRTRSWLTRWSADPAAPPRRGHGLDRLRRAAARPAASTSRSTAPTSGCWASSIAAWPAARLVGEPLFGWVADRAPRKPLMVVGLFGAAVATSCRSSSSGRSRSSRCGPWPACSPRSTTRPRAATSSTPTRRERHGETFGLYGAAQMGGLMLGPAVGGIAVALTARPDRRLLGGRGRAVHRRRPHRAPHRRAVHGRARRALARAPPSARSQPKSRPASFAAAPRPRNQFLAAAIVMNLAWFFTSGAYEVVWSLYLTSIGGTIELVGLTFAAFALPDARRWGRSPAGWSTGAAATSRCSSAWAWPRAAARSIR